MYPTPSMLRRLGLAVAMVGAALLASASSVAAQTTYTYVGNGFTLFSCGPNSTNTGTINCSTPAPTNPNTSYIATDHVTATVVLDNPLPANLTYQDIRTFAGFSLTLNDEHQTIATPLSSGQGMFAEVSTDANGNILDWRFLINTGGVNNGGIATYTAPFGFVSDQGTLKCCDPVPGGDFARNVNIRGVWTIGTASPTPEAAVSNLMAVVMDPLLGLTAGQINSLEDKLNSALASIEAGLYKQAINQLTSFVNSVNSSVKNGKMSPTAGATLVNAANAIIALLE